MGSIRRFGYSLCAIGVPGGCTPMLDCGGCTIIFGSIFALSERRAVFGLGTMAAPGKAAFVVCEPDGSLLKSPMG